MRERTAEEKNIIVPIDQDLTLVGKHLSFSIFPCEPIKDFHSLERMFGKMVVDLATRKPGFRKFGTLDCYAKGIFTFPIIKEHDGIVEGNLRKIPLGQVEEAELFFVSNAILATGKNSAIQMALQLMTPKLNVASKPVKLSQERLYDLTEEAVVVKDVKFKNIPHSEVESVALKGELEDIYMGDDKMRLREGSINSFTGVYNTPYGLKTVSWSGTGKVKIFSSKRSCVNLQLAGWVLEKVGALRIGVPWKTMESGKGQEKSE